MCKGLACAWWWLQQWAELSKPLTVTPCSDQAHFFLSPLPLLPSCPVLECWLPASLLPLCDPGLSVLSWDNPSVTHPKPGAATVIPLFITFFRRWAWMSVCIYNHLTSHLTFQTVLRYRTSVFNTVTEAAIFSTDEASCIKEANTSSLRYYLKQDAFFFCSSLIIWRARNEKERTNAYLALSYLFH